MGEDAPKRKGGRPRVEKHVSVSTWIRVDDYDSLLKLAKQHEASLSALVRQLIKLRIPR